MRALALALLLAACASDATAPKLPAPPSLDFYAACTWPVLFWLHVDNQPIGIWYYNLVGSGSPVSIPTSMGVHSASWWQLDAEAHVLGGGQAVLNVRGPTRVTMECAGGG